MTGGISPSVPQLEWQIIPRAGMPIGLYQEIVAFCMRAYDEDLAALMGTFEGATHCLGRRDGRLVSHTLWVQRWLQPGAMPPLRTAYVEMVAVDTACRGHGHGPQIMERILPEIGAFELAALSPFSVEWYTALGWKRWTGPLSIRTPAGPIATPGEDVMIFRLPHTPTLDLTQPLSAEWREGEPW